MYKIRSSCRHFIYSFHSYFVLWATFLYRTVQTQTQTHKQYRHSRLLVLFHICSLRARALPRNTDTYNQNTEPMFIQPSANKNSTIQRIHPDAKTANIKNNRKYRKIFTRRTNKLKELFEFFFDKKYVCSCCCFRWNFIIEFSSQLPELSS